MPVPYELVVSQGRIADRTPGAIPGAALTAEALGKRTGLQPITIGIPSPAKEDDWSASLPEAGETLAGLQTAIAATLQRGDKSLLIANTCSASLATLPVVARERADAVLLWIDAHGDFNTPQTTESGYLGGMVLAAACGLWKSGHGSGLDPKQVVIVGARDIDPAEMDLLQQAGVRIVSPAEATPEAILSSIGDAPVWIHVDWDVLEPNHVPAAYAIGDGLYPRTLRAIFAAIPKEQIAGIELAEFEASEDARRDEAAIECLLGIVEPLLA
ncbi:arginase family protein (plasmid) [Ensifer sp. PDNC004]|uniref:arginase family protein n=1 Tax=Ensifer sp. PDNC004 TaxID=2811423 RepID=UPI001963C310|nr:arginase family protein [Ensifer sp. PDNC004]QRY65162.1 arginase family protein [Ensifer sp. PDNC004]